MCGIAGILVRSASPAAEPAELARAMAGTLAHRGPDDSGVWVPAGARVALSHRRLSIVDLSTNGRNPMLFDDGRLAITYNGEVYNFRSLRIELERLGHRFRSQTDTEVILAAYKEWGVASVDRLAGMFAFALWDQAHDRLWLVRDRLGKKPLYYAQHGGILRFGSEIKALLVDRAVPRTIDRTALALYLRYGYVPAPYTIFEAIRKVEPGHYLVVEGDRLDNVRYWDPLQFTSGPAHRTDEELEQRLEHLLGEAVEQRLIADVPLGAFLSGGVDSSLVVALMQERSGQRVQTFTIRFDEPEFNEADHAAAVARHLGTDHHEQRCSEQSMLDLIDRLPDIFDEPFGDSSAIPSYLVSAAARQHVTVALSGDGGDELFFGYPRYTYHADQAWVLALPPAVRHWSARLAGHLPNRRLRRIADVLRSDDPDLYGRFVAWCSPEDVAALAGVAPLDAPEYARVLAGSAGIPVALRPSVLDVVSYLPDDILTKVDRVSMAVSLEVRAPLLDHRVAEFALGLPLHAKRRGRETKWLLRRLLYKRVPRELIDRPKMGFGVPLQRWFLGPLRDRMDDYCAGPDLESVGLAPEPVRRMWRQFKAGQHHRPDLLWQMAMLVAWSRRVPRMSAAA